MSAKPQKTEKNLRDRIVEVATQLFAEQGYSATSIRQVVEACSCTKPSLYYYFENKETLFSEIVDMHLAASDELIDNLSKGDGPARDRIHATVSAFADWAANNPNAMRLLQRVETQHEDGAPEVNVVCAREMHLEIMQQQIERGQQLGEIRSGVDAFDCALVIAGSLSFQFELNLSNEHWDRDRLHRTVDIIFDGIAADGKAADGKAA